MKKFVFMILGATVFFMGLGELAKQIGNYFIGDQPEMTFVRTSDENIQPPDNMKSSKKLLIINNMKERTREFNVRIAPSLLREKMEQPLEFERQPSSEPLPEGVELPRISEHDILIQRNDSENPSVEMKTPQVRVFIDKEKMTK